jgi:hypothetical protein
MVAAANFPIYYDAVINSTLLTSIEPVMTFAGPPPAQYMQQAVGFAGQFNGVNQMVCTCLQIPSVIKTYG